MKLNRWLLPAALVAALAVAGGCKKDTAVTKKSLNGELKLSVPAVVEVGYTKTFMIDTLMTLSCPDGSPIGYYFVDPDTNTRDTLVNADGSFRKHLYTLTVADKRESQTLTLTAFMDKDSDYTGQSGTATFLIVRGGLDEQGSLTRFNASASAGSFQDARDGREYYYTSVNGLDWLRHNLAWTGAGVPAWNCDAMTGIFGRYYTWEEAQTACPEGWRLPTDAELTALQDGAAPGEDIKGLAGRLMGDIYFNGDRLWEYWREVKITDAFLFSAIPAGYANVGGGAADFRGQYTYAAFWTADEEDGEGICRYIFHSKDIVYRGKMSKTDFAASVRCVR